MSDQMMFYPPDSEAPRDGQRVLMIGHSSHTWERFAELLTSHGVRVLVDVRTLPRSRFSPQFNKTKLTELLRTIGIRYMHVKELGGKNPLPVEEQRMFLAGLALEEGMCFMCSEANYLDCHRHYTLTPLLLDRGVHVEQILPSGGGLRDDGPTQATLRKMEAFLPR